MYEIKQKLINNKSGCIFIEPQFNTNVIDFIRHGTNFHKGILDPYGTTIPISKNSYLKLLLQLSNQYIHCLQKT